ncbi:MAG: hypothetical protein CND89_02345 [Marine Group II euryarchaeote MED-G38]|nr:hypothetical protein [Euryarchaeota archaeon]PDH23245.1 MAG: hypothetical protein CND89_02345 [Marine Group II euryarchaeote MED-G38]
MKIAFLDTDLVSLCMAHKILDNLECEIHFFTESAELGMYGEEPGLIDNWPLLNSSWISSIFSQEPNSDSTAVRKSWLKKAISISLADRNCFFHLRTRITKINSRTIEFVGAGFAGSGNIFFNHILNQEVTKSENLWYGGTTLEIPKIDNILVGKRSDSIIEIWSEDKLPTNINWIQQMQWQGTNPKNSIDSEINMGMLRGDEFLNSHVFLK